jgi:hypothetical protein
VNGLTIWPPPPPVEQPVRAPGVDGGGREGWRQTDHRVAHLERVEVRRSFYERPRPSSHGSRVVGDIGGEEAEDAARQSGKDGVSARRYGYLPPDGGVGGCGESRPSDGTRCGDGLRLAEAAQRAKRVQGRRIFDRQRARRCVFGDR